MANESVPKETTVIEDKLEVNWLYKSMHILNKNDPCFLSNDPRCPRPEELLDYLIVHICYHVRHYHFNVLASVVILVSSHLIEGAACVDKFQAVEIFLAWGCDTEGHNFVLDGKCLGVDLIQFRVSFRVKEQKSGVVR